MTEELTDAQKLSEIRDRVAVLLKRGAVGHQVDAWASELKYLSAAGKRLESPQGAYLDGEWFGGYYGGK